MRPAREAAAILAAARDACPHHADPAAATLSILASAWSLLTDDPSSRSLFADLPTFPEISAPAPFLDAISRVREHATETSLHGTALAIERIYESLLLHDAAASGSTRARLGAVYTPRPLALSLTRDAWSRLAPTAPPRVLDPSCGSGRFLLACLDVAASSNAPLPILHGNDIDPSAVFITRLLLHTHPLLARQPHLAQRLTSHIRCCDALATQPAPSFDLVLGNPPFLNQLERNSARAATQSRRLREATQGIIKGYADTASAFLHHAITLTRPGGITCMIQPLSVLAARDARPLRAWFSTTASLESLWVGDTHAFAASVFACAITARKLDAPPPHDAPHSVRLSRGLPPRRVARVRATRTTRWSVLAARACDVPNLTLDPKLPTLRDWLDATADFRDVYYALRDLIIDAPEPDAPEPAPPEAAVPSSVPSQSASSKLIPILNTGLIELAATSWGRSPARLYRQRWLRPAFDLAIAQQHPHLSRVLPLRLQPKLILATQTRIIEAFVDQFATWMPTTPLISLTPRANAPDLHTIAAALCSPVCTLVAARRTFGTSMSPRAIKLAAREALDLPIPRDASLLIPAAEAFRDAAAAHAHTDHAAYAAALDAFADRAITAYQLSPSDHARVLDWWQARRTSSRARGRATP